MILVCGTCGHTLPFCHCDSRTTAAPVVCPCNDSVTAPRCCGACTKSDPPPAPDATVSVSVTLKPPGEPMFNNMNSAVETLNAFYDHCIDTFTRKNRGYADTERTRDVLRNFREEAARHGITMLQLAGIYRGKHERGWDTFLRTGATSDESWRLLKDRLVYTLLEYLICLDQGLFTHEQVMGDTGKDA